MSRRPFWKNFFSGRWCTFSNEVFQKILTCTKKFQVCHEGFLRVQWNISGNNFLVEIKNLNLSSSECKIIGLQNGATDVMELAKVQSMYPENHFELNEFFSKKNFFWIYFLNLGEEIPEFLRKFPPRVSKPYSTRRGTILNKFRNIFLGILEKTLIWTRKLQFCQESFLHLQGNNLLGETKLGNPSGSDWKMNGRLGKVGNRFAKKRIPHDKWILLRKTKLLSKKKIRLWIHFLNYSETSSFFLAQ